MARAVAQGRIRPGRADPNDPRFWRTLHWILDETSRENNLLVALARHQHWTSLAANSRLPAATFADASQNAMAAIQHVLRLAYPWLKDQLAQPQDSREALVDEFREVFGKPGEKKYEANMAAIQKVFEKYKWNRRSRQGR